MNTSSPSKSSQDAEEASKRRLEERFGTGGMAGMGSAPLEEDEAADSTVSKLKVTLNSTKTVSVKNTLNFNQTVALGIVSAPSLPPPLPFPPHRLS